jgi:hypothetical protein
MDDYQQFLDRKTQLGADSGFEPLWIPDFLFDFQRALVEWAVRKGRCAIFADCGLGKTPMQLVWAENVARKTGRPVLILTPLAVAQQTEREAQKFGIGAAVSRDGTIPAQITITNYQKLHHFDREKFAGVVCDESSILKNFDGATRGAVTDFMRKTPYRLLCTATAAPNDYIELGTHSEAIGDLGFTDMVAMFFKKQEKTTCRADEYRSGLYRFRGHAQRDFWRWVCSWARALRSPADLGFDHDGFRLPPLRTAEHVVSAKKRREGWLFDLAAVGLQEQREERRRTITERCEMAASLVNHDHPAVCWCHLIPEGNMLEKLIPGAVEIEGSDSDERKEEVLDAFAKGQVRVLVSKPSICGFGLNWQHCAHQTFFPSHSFEQWYQAVRRCWRFGQKNPVRVDVVSSEGEAGVLGNLNRKAAAADEMFANLVSLMDNELKVEKAKHQTKKEEIPTWL